MGGKKRAVKKPTLPETPWDLGTGTEAQQRNMIIEGRGEDDPKTGQKKNPNGVKGVRRMDYIETLMRSGVISFEGFSAAERLIMAWEAMQKSPPAIQEIQVDCSRQPDASMAAQVDLASKYHQTAKMFPAGAFDLVYHCTCQNRAIREFHGVNSYNYREWYKRLSDALNAAAEEMGIASEDKFR